MDTNTYPKMAGVYRLTCIKNGKIYIGKSFNIRQRLNRHKRDSIKLKDGGYFQRAIIKHGWDSFKVDILEIMEEFDKSRDGPVLLEKEASYIRLFISNNERIGYNVCEYSTDRTGYKCSDLHKKRISQSNMGKKMSDESKDKIRQANLGKKLSDTTREKMRNKKLSPETKEKISQSNMGKKMSDESKAKLSKARLGIKFSEEHREKLRQAKLGKPLSEERKEKLKGPRGPQKNKRKSKYADN